MGKITLPSIFFNVSLTLTLTKPSYYPHIDLLRVFFVFVVLLHHWVAENPWAYLPFGSTIAFVLSGFLLTGPLLYGKQSQNNYWHIATNFLARRLLRTVPLYLLVLVLYLVANQNDFRNYAVYFFTFTQNYAMLLGKPISFIQTWSLAVQEQFYVVLPIAIYLIPYKYLKSFFVLLCFVGLAVRCWYFYKDYNFVYNHFTTQACVDCFGMGALIAYYHTEHPEKLKKIVLNKWLFMGIVLVYICSTLGYFNDGKDIFNNLYRTTERTLVSILCVWFIGWGIYYPSKLLHTLSTHAFITYCSKISYGIYVYHFLVSSVILQILHKFDATISNYAWWVIVLKFVFTISVSAVSYKFIEAPILLLKKRYFTDNIQEKTIAMPMVFYLN